MFKLDNEEAEIIRTEAIKAYAEFKSNIDKVTKEGEEAFKAYRHLEKNYNLMGITQKQDIGMPLELCFWNGEGLAEYVEKGGDINLRDFNGNSLLEIILNI